MRSWKCWITAASVLGIEIVSVPPSRSELHHAQVPAVLNHSRTVPQGDGRAGPALDRSPIGRECDLIILNAGDVLDDAFAVRGPGIDAEGEVGSRGHQTSFLPMSVPPIRERAGFPAHRRGPDGGSSLCRGVDRMVPAGRPHHEPITQDTLHPEPSRSALACCTSRRTGVQP